MIELDFCVQIIPVKPYIHMKYIPVKGQKEYCDKIRYKKFKHLTLFASAFARKSTLDVVFLKMLYSTNQCSGSVAFWYGYGSLNKYTFYGSGSCSSCFQDVNKNRFFC
jgi:hypothetical protein